MYIKNKMFHLARTRTCSIIAGRMFSVRIGMLTLLKNQRQNGFRKNYILKEF